MPRSTPPPRRWQDRGAQTEPAPWVIREPLRSTIGTQTDVFTDPMQQEEFVAAVQPQSALHVAVSAPEQYDIGGGERAPRLPGGDFRLKLYDEKYVFQAGTL